MSVSILLFCVVSYLFVPLVHATQVCVSPESASWTSDQRVWRHAIAYRLAFEAGQNIQPTIAGSTICFTDPTFNVEQTLCDDVVDGICTGQKLLDKMTQQVADNDLEIQSKQQRDNTLQSEIQGNDYCLGELSELQTRIDTATTNWVAARQAEVDASPNNVAGVKTLIRNQLIPGIGQALNAGFLKALRCLKARTDRGVGQ